MADIAITIPQPDVAAPADQLGVERAIVNRVFKSAKVLRQMKFQ